MRRILISGSRTLEPYDQDFDRSLGLLQGKPENFEEFTVMHGGAKGVDQAGGDWAMINGFEVEEVLANWDKHGKAAGHIRNAEMVNSGVDLAIVFWDGESKGTAGTMKLLRAARINHVVTVLYAD